MNPEVTVIVPVYNSEKYIKKCIESILNQTFKKFELLIINDGSKDNSQKIIEEYQKKDPERIVIVNQENKGVSRTRNEAIKMANGKYLMFIDNDDYIDKDYRETFVNAIKENDLDVVLGGYRRPNEEGKVIKELHLKDEEWSKFMIFAPWAKIYKKEYLINNDITFLPVNIGEDVYFNIQAMFLSEKIKIIDYVGYNWFFNTKSVSNTVQKNIKNLQVYDLLNKCYYVIKEKKILEKNYEIMEMYFIRYIVWVLLFSIKKLDYKTINEEYKKIFSWLKEKFPNYKKNKLLGLRKPKGEILEVRVIVYIFMTLHKLHLLSPILFIYSKI